MNLRTLSLLLLLVILPLGSLLAQTNLQGTWKGELIRNGFEWNTTVHIGMFEEKQTVKISFPDWGMFRLATDSINISNNKIAFKVLWLNTNLEATLDGQILTITSPDWNNATGKFHRVFNESNLYKREYIQLKTDDNKTLKGTIVFPDTDPPYKGMVLTHGSGPDTRITGPYISKAHLAVESGLAVLIYDKRGAGESEGSGFNTLDRLTKDALDMVDLLRNHPSINSNYVGIGGLSQGAWIAPKAAYIDSRIAFVFTTATPGVSPAEQNVYSLETRIDSVDKKHFAKKALRTLYEFYRTNDQDVRSQAIKLINDEKYDLKSSEMFVRLMFSENGSIPEKVDPGFWANAMFEDPLIWWREIKVPVGSFSGKDDNNVPTTLSNKLIKASLEDAGNTNYEMHLFPNSGHGLSLNNLPEKDWPRMAYGYIPMMEAWFKKIAKSNN